MSRSERAKKLGKQVVVEILRTAVALLLGQLLGVPLRR